MHAKVALYDAVDNRLTHFEVDVENATLTPRATVTVPSNVQYAWPHPNGRVLYVATSNRGAGLKSDCNHLTALRIDPATGALSPLGEPQGLPHRAVHICVDATGGFVLSGHNLPKSGVTVTRINAAGSLGAQVAQPHALDYGIYPHQIRITPSNRATIVVDRGNNAEHGKPEDPGALRIFRLEDGVHSALPGYTPAAPNGGYGFGPRHLDFHPTQPWIYISLERQNLLHMFRFAENGDGVEPLPAYVRPLLANPADVANAANHKSRQLSGTIHVHPNGRFVYVMNRGDASMEFQGKKVFTGGENNIAVFAIDPVSGEPTLIQHADTHSIHVRTFAIDPSGRLLVAASILPMWVRDGDAVVNQPAALTLFRMGDDGKLTFVRDLDIETHGGTQYWMGMVGLGLS